MATYIKFENISKSFKTQNVLSDVNFDLEKGNIYGFIGRNGSGKTVIFKLLTGLLIPTKGSIYLEGVDLTKEKRFPPSMGVLIETPGFIPHYSGLKNLSILNDLTKQKVSVETMKETMKLVGLDPDNKKHVRNYSLGMRQKLGIAQAVMHKPDLLILDEPMNGLDEQSVQNMRTFFKMLKEEYKTTILLASHNKEDIEVLCDNLFYLRDGCLLNQEEIN